MRHQFLLLPVAAIVAAQPAVAQSMIGVEQSQARMFPGATFAQNFITLTDPQFDTISKKSQVKIWGKEVKAWKVSTGGWYILDRSLARDSFITFAVALDPDGTVLGVEVLQCDAHYDVSNAAWLKQFRDKKHDDLNLPAEIRNISGSSLSSDAVKDGVKRLLVTYDVLLASAR